MTARTHRLRFAPSPTGPLHLGGARTALYNWAAARALGGKFLLRIEDTDQARSTDASLRIILDGLRWLGIDWDEGPEVGGEFGPYFQMQRLDLYARYARRLLDAGKAYECFCTPAEIEAGRERLAAAGAKTMYDRRCRDLSAEQREAMRASGRVPAIRARLPLDEVLTIHDHCKGDVEVRTSELDDWVMLRPDGVPLYNFACVVDDAEMQISHVVRGEEHFMNGFKQVLMFRDLGLTPPEYAHIPLILGKDGKKLSKREASTNVLEYRDRGFPADAVFNYIATLGWGFSGDRDVFTRAEMIERFGIDQIGRAGAKFDEEKLLAICGEYIRKTPIDALVDIVRPFVVAAGALPESAFVEHRGWVRNLVACYHERMRTYGELPPKLAPFAAQAVTLDEAAVGQIAKHPQSRAWLTAYADALVATNLAPSYPDDRSAFDAACALPHAKTGLVAAFDSALFLTPEHLERHARVVAEQIGAKFGHFVQPVRAALTGTTTGPSLFDVVFVLGKQTCVARLRAAAAAASPTA